MSRRSPLVLSRTMAISLLVACLIAAYTWLLPQILYLRSKPVTAYPAMPSLQPNDRITILAPHLDDETLGAGGLIATARESGIPVSIIFMTNGDDFPLAANLEFKTGYPTPDQLLAFGATRQQEAIKAAEKLGVSQDSLYFLGLPDRGLKSLIAPEHATAPITSKGTLKNNSAYSLSYIPGLPYTGDDARAALIKALNQTAPTKIFTTSVRDTHTDHASTGRILQEVIPSITSKPQTYYFVIHFPNYPWPRGIRESADLLPPPGLSKKISSWKILPLTERAEGDKDEAIDQYHTQLRLPTVKTLLKSMVRRNELFYTN